tara:strand:+ start:329 stop:1291 length:963 start_codon:yes stop_codon:yes gene_type:complete
MAFKMNPKSPLLMKAMGISPAKNMNKGYGPAKTSSPAKNMNKGYGPMETSSPAKQLSEGSGNEDAKDETKNYLDISERLPREDKARNISKEIESEPVKKASVKKTKATNKRELTPKEKALQKLKEAEGDNEVANIEKETSKVQKNSTRKRKQAARKKSQAERRAEKTRVLEERIKRRRARRSPAKQSKKADKSVFGPDGKNAAKPPKNQKKSKYDILFEDIANKAKKKKTSPAKQTAKQKANLPKEIVNAIAAKSPAKQVDKAGQRIIRQGEKAEAAYKAGNVKKGNRHKVRAKRMGGRYDAKMLKNNLKGGLRNNNAQG